MSPRFEEQLVAKKCMITRLLPVVFGTSLGFFVAQCRGTPFSQRVWVRVVMHLDYWRAIYHCHLVLVGMC